MRKYFQAPWRFKEILFIFLAVETLIIALGFLQFSFEIPSWLKENEGRSFAMAAIILIQGLIFLGPVAIYTKRNYKTLSAKQFGLNNIGVIKTIWSATKGYILFIGISILIGILILYTDIRIPGYQPQERILPLFGTEIHSLIVAGIAIIIFAPIIEELFFRGFLLRGLVNKIGTFYGSIITAGVFAIFHMQLSSIIPFFILGLIINSLVIKTKSIWPAIAFHMLNNTIAFTIEVLLLYGAISVDIDQMV